MLARPLVAMVAVLSGCSAPKHVADPRNRCPIRVPQAREVIGTSSDTDSALRPTEIHVAARLAGVLAGSERDTTDWAFAADALIRKSWVAHTVVAGASLGWLQDQQGDSSAWQTGNLHLGYGYRRYRWGEAGDTTQTSDDSSSGDHTYRRALGFRITADIDPGSKGVDGTNQRSLGTLFPMESTRHAPGHHVRAVAEARYELVGCYAPFVHAQVGAGTSVGEDAVVSARGEEASALTDWQIARTAFVVPLSIAIGTHDDVSALAGRDSSATVYAEYAALIGRIPLALDDQRALNPRTALGIQSRVRLGLAVAHAIPFGATFDIQLGAIDGVFGSLWINVPWGSQ